MSERLAWVTWGDCPKPLSSSKNLKIHTKSKSYLPAYIHVLGVLLQTKQPSGGTHRPGVWWRMGQGD